MANQPEHPAPAPGSPGAWRRLSQRFKLHKTEVRLGQQRLFLPELPDPLAYIEGRGQGDLPYWTKVWPAALVLAELALALKPGGGPILELGAGLGLPGLAAASQGRRVILSDLDPDALEFAQAAVEINGLEEFCQVRSLDWTAPPPDLTGFSTILGAEVLYQPELYPRLVTLLGGLLAPGGTAYLSHQERPFAIGFFKLAQERFTIRATQRTLRGEDGPLRIILYALKKA
ncbi:MAG: methyltransferase [Desulfarculus sp.]|nr:methyltransferase [Desulfarculus sp.]